MLSIQDISDRLEIQQLIVDYANAIDMRDFGALDRIFTPDAYIDYRALGGIDDRYPGVKAWLAQVLPNFSAYQHLVGNIAIRIEGDSATSRTACFNPMAVPLADGSTHVMFLGLWYLDKFVRTADGWRMCERVEEKSYDRNVPLAATPIPIDKARH